MPKIKVPCQLGEFAKYKHDNGNVITMVPTSIITDAEGSQCVWCMTSLSGEIGGEIGEDCIAACQIDKKTKKFAYTSKFSAGDTVVVRKLKTKFQIDTVEFYLKLSKVYTKYHLKTSSGKPKIVTDAEIVRA